MGCIHDDDLNPTATTTGCHYGGVAYKQGESFKEDCNTCHCGSNGMVICTKMLCPPGCHHDGAFYQPGESFKVDCNTCTCTKNGAACTLMGCIHDDDLNPTATTTGCHYGGVAYKQGESFKEDCNTCHCGSNGMVICTKMLCPPGCHHDGAFYQPGESFKVDCNTCICGQNSEATQCTLMACPPVGAPPVV